MEQEVAHTSADQQGLKAASPQGIANRVGMCPRVHEPIMLQWVVYSEKEEWRGSCALCAAKYQAGDVVELARRSDEFIHALHQELQGLLGIAVRKIADRFDPSDVAKFLAAFVEGFDDTVREQDQSVPGEQLDASRLESSLRVDAQGHAAAIEPFDAAILPPHHG